jgi:high-affinity iron transporter
MGQVLFIVWRESVEALLVIGILHAWLCLGNRAARQGLVYLWSGVLAGAVVAILLAVALIVLGEYLVDDAQTWFQIGMLLTGAVLIVQMVFWMRQHGRTLKQNIKVTLEKNDATGHWWGVFVLAMLAVAREGSEMAVFIYGIRVSQEIALPSMLLAAAIGLVMAYGTFHVLQLGGKVLSWPRFFRITEILLLLLAAGLVISGVERLLDVLLENSDVLLAVDWLMVLTGEMWDTSAIVSEHGFVGGLLSTMIGYRARPTWCNLLTIVLYWSVIGWLLWRQSGALNKKTACIR